MLGAELLHQLLDQRRDLGRRGVGEGDQPVRQVRGGVGRVELFDQRLDDGEILGRRPDQQASGAGFGHDREARRALALLGLGLGLTTPTATGTEDVVQGAGHDHRVGLAQGQNAQVAFARGGLPRKVGDHAVDPVQFRSRAREDQSVGIPVQGHGDLGRLGGIVGLGPIQRWQAIHQFDRGPIHLRIDIGQHADHLFDRHVVDR